jgi:hypothetical protein
MDDVIALLSGVNPTSATPPPTLPKPAIYNNPITATDTAIEPNMFSLNCTKPQIRSPQIRAEGYDINLGTNKLPTQLYTANSLQFYPYPNYEQFLLPSEAANNLQSPPMHPIIQQVNVPPIVKTNTWPMRPGKDIDIFTPDDPKLESELEFQQFVNSVKQRSRRGHLNNPWSEDGATWSPLIYDTRFVNFTQGFSRLVINKFFINE